MGCRRRRHAARVPRVGERPDERRRERVAAIGSRPCDRSASRTGGALVDGSAPWTSSGVASCATSGHGTRVNASSCSRSSPTRCARSSHGFAQTAASPRSRPTAPLLPAGHSRGRRYSAGSPRSRRRSRVPSRAEAIEVLIATDLLSEGLNLQDAAVVVHLDLPWTTARLTQRLGRIWRIGSQHARVHEYAIAPPAAADRLLRIVQVLTRKAGAAWSAIGEPFLPLLASRLQSDCDARAARSSASRRSATHADPFLDGFGFRRTVRIDGRATESLAAGHRRSWSRARARRSTAGSLPSRWAASRSSSRHEPSGEATTDPAMRPRGRARRRGTRMLAAPSRVERVIRELDAYLDASRAAADAGVAARRLARTRDCLIADRCTCRRRAASPTTGSQSARGCRPRLGSRLAIRRRGAATRRARRHRALATRAPMPPRRGWSG